MSVSRVASPFLLVLAVSLAGCPGADFPLSPTTPTPPLGGWAGSWSASNGEAGLRLSLSRRQLGEFWDISYSITGLGTLTPPGSEGAPISLSVKGYWMPLSGMVLEIYDQRLPENPSPGTIVPATLLATFRATFVSDTLLVGTLTAEDSLLATGEIRFRRR